MSNAPVIHIEDAELAEGITDSAARGTPLRVEVGGKMFVLRVTRGGQHEGIWAGYDPDQVREAIDKYAGTWSDLDVEEMKANLYRAREEGTRPPDRP
jgi:hypothetical protein